MTDRAQSPTLELFATIVVPRAGKRVAATTISSCGRRVASTTTTVSGRRDASTVTVSIATVPTASTAETTTDGELRGKYTRGAARAPRIAAATSPATRAATLDVMVDTAAPMLLSARAGVTAANNA